MRIGDITDANRVDLPWGDRDLWAWCLTVSTSVFQTEGEGSIPSVHSMYCEHCEQLKLEMTWLHDEIESLESRLNLFKALSETSAPTLSERIDQVATTTKQVVIIGRNGVKENTWFAHCCGLEIEAPSAVEALESLIVVLKKQANEDRYTAQKRADDAAKFETL